MSVQNHGDIHSELRGHFLLIYYDSRSKASALHDKGDHQYWRTAKVAHENFIKLCKCFFLITNHLDKKIPSQITKHISSNDSKTQTEFSHCYDPHLSAHSDMATPLGRKLVAESSNDAVLHRITDASNLVVVDDPALVSGAVVARDVVVNSAAP